MLTELVKKYLILMNFSPFETSKEEPALNIDLSCFSGNLRRDDNENARNCWRISDGNNFKVRGKSFCEDKRKVSNL